MRFVIGGIVLCVLTLTADSGELIVRGANLTECTQSLPEQYSAEQRYRICELRRARSLLYRGLSVCTASMSADAPGACNMQDSSGSLPVNEHTADFPLQPIMNGNIGKVYGGRRFTYDGKLHRIENDGRVRRRRSNTARWETLCTLVLDDISCTYASGNNTSTRSTKRNAVNCTLEYFIFQPELLKVTVTEAHSEINAVTEQVFNPFWVEYKTFYSCVVNAEETALGWN